jgi:hypothetical protein
MEDELEQLGQTIKGKDKGKEKAVEQPKEQKGNKVSSVNDVS